MTFLSISQRNRLKGPLCWINLDIHFREGLYVQLFVEATILHNYWRFQHVLNVEGRNVFDIFMTHSEKYKVHNLSSRTNICRIPGNYGWWTWKKLKFEEKVLNVVKYFSLHTNQADMALLSLNINNIFESISVLTRYWLL